MADVFVSYRRDNLPKVQLLVKALREAGVTVWWDKDIPPDAPWERTIEHEHKHAKAVIVAWSESAVLSDNVKAEARRAREQGRLLQIFLEPCDLPMFFGERQGLDFAGWAGSAKDPRFKTLLTAVEALKAGTPPPSGVGYSPKRIDTWGFAWQSVVALSVVIGILASFGGARDAVCQLGPVNAVCRKLQIAPTPPVDPVAEARLARRALITSLDGKWIRPDGDCKMPMSITTLVGADGVDRIRINYGQDYQSEGQVIAAEGGTVTSRDIAVKPGATRNVWEFRPYGDQLEVKDKDGVTTALLRCRIAP